MTELSGTHLPSPEFRASLEHELIRTLRREARFAPPSSTRPRTRRHDRLRAIAILVVGLILGVGTQFASAQVHEARQQGDLLSALTVDRNVALLRVRVARANHDEIRRGVESGALSPQSLLVAAAELRSAELSAFRLELDLREVQASSAAPRDELWAPVIGEQDFVRQRLTLRASAAQQRLAAAEAGVEAAERGARAGVTPPAALSQAGFEAAEARREFQVLAQRLMLRDEFVKARLTPEEVTLRAQRFELQADVQRAQQHLTLARKRLQVARELIGRGAVGELEVKRAELDVMERTVALDRLVAQYRLAEVRGR
jgi:hypothetical protein